MALTIMPWPKEDVVPSLQAEARDLMPLMVQAEAHLSEIAAPQAVRLAERIRVVMDELGKVADDVALYYAKWCGPEVAARIQVVQRVRRHWVVRE